MAKGEDITTRYKCDISDLKKGISEANKNIKLANAQFKAVSEGMDNWAKSSDGVSAKLKQLGSILTEQNKKLQNYKKQQSEMDKAYTENGKRADELRVKLNELASKGIAKTSDEYKQYQKALNEVEKEQISNKKASDDLKITILNQQGAINKTQKEIKNYEATLKEMQTQQSKTATATDKLTKEIEEQQQELNELKSKYKDVVLEQGKNSNEAKSLAKEISNLSEKLKNSKSELKNTSKAADELDKSLDIDTDTPTNGFTVMKGALASLVADGIRKAIDAIKEFVSETIEVGKKFDTVMSEVEAISNANSETLEKLRDKAKEMGATTKFSASESAEAFKYMAMAGWDTEDMLNGIEGILKLAAASGTDLATTSDIVTDALTAMGYEAKDAGKLADVMAAASSNANTNVEMMGATFQYAAPIIGALKYNMEDAAVAIGLMANNGIKGEKAGTALRSMLTRLSAPPKECASAMKKLGISITNTDGTMKPLKEVMNDLRKAFDGLSEAEQAQYAKQIAGQEAMSGLLSIVNAAPEDYNKLTEAVKNSNGAAEDMSKTMQDNLEGDMTQLKSKLEGVQIGIYEFFEPALRAGVDILGKLVDALNWASENLDWLTPIVTGLATAFGVLAGALAIQGLITGVAKAMQFLNTTILANPIMLIVAAISGLVVAFIGLWNNCEGFRNFWIGLWDGIKSVAQSVWEAITSFFTNAWNIIQSIWNGVGEFFSGIWESIKSIFSTVTETISGFFTNAWNAIVVVWNLVAQWFNTNVIEPIKTFFAPLVEWFTQLFTSIWDFIRSVFEVIAQLAEGCWNAIVLIWGVVSEWFNQNIIQPLTEFFTNLWNTIKEMAQNTWNGIVEIWTIVADWFDQHIITPIRNFFTDLWNVISTAGKNAWNAIKAVWEIVSAWFSETIIQPISNFFTSMWENLKTGASNAWQGIKSVFSNVANFFKNTFQKAWQKVKEVFSVGGKIFDGIKEGIVNAFKNVVNAIIRGINKVVAMPFNAINSVLDKIRNIDIFGAKPFEGLIGRISVPQIPELEKGGILKKGQVGLLEGNGTEAVVPLDKNKYWIGKVADELKSQLVDLKGNVANTSNSITNSNTNNFTQIINTPKPLSRIEIYRQTRNLLALREG